MNSDYKVPTYNVRDPFIASLLKMKTEDNILCSCIKEIKISKFLLSRIAYHKNKLIDLINTPAYEINNWFSYNETSKVKILNFKADLIKVFEQNVKDWPNSELCKKIKIPVVIAKEKIYFRILKDIAKTINKPISAFCVNDLLNNITDKMLYANIDVSSSLLNDVHQHITFLLSFNTSKSPHGFIMDNKAIDSFLSISLCTYQSSIKLNMRAKKISGSFLGFTGYSKDNLSAIGRSFSPNLSRETVRQLQERETNNIISIISIDMPLLWKSVSKTLSFDAHQKYPLLRAMFINDDCFKFFLDTVFRKKRGTVNALIRPLCSDRELYELFETNLMPVSIKTFKAHFQESLELSNLTASNLISNLKVKGKIKENKFGLTCYSLPHNTAVLQASLNFSEGSQIKWLYERVVADKFTQANVTIASVRNSINNIDALHLYGIMSYINGSFLIFSNSKINEVLEEARTALEAASAKGVNAIHLRYDLYSNINFELNYYAVRYILKNFGHEKGIYFFGKSNTDNLSLEQNIEKGGLQNRILNILKKHEQPVSRSVIKDGMLEISHRYTNNLINIMREDLMVVRMNNNTLALPSVAFKGVNTLKLVNQITDICSLYNKPIDIELLKEKLNTENVCDTHEKWYYDFIGYHKHIFPKRIHFKDGFVSLSEITLPCWRNIMKSNINSPASVAHKALLQFAAISKPRLSRLINNKKNQTSKVRSCG